jgi:hypothetical protein
MILLADVLIERRYEGMLPSFWRVAAKIGGGELQCYCAVHFKEELALAHESADASSAAASGACSKAHITHHTSHITRHTSHVTNHTSHVTNHTAHITHHTSHSHLRLDMQRIMCPVYPEHHAWAHVIRYDQPLAVCIAYEAPVCAAAGLVCRARRPPAPGEAVLGMYGSSVRTHARRGA